MEKQVSIIKYKNGKKEKKLDKVAEEVPLTIFLNGEELITLLCTPEYLEDLAVGFLVAEGILVPEVNLKVQVQHEKGLIWVEAEKVSKLGKASFGKRMVTTGCGKGTSLFQYHGRGKIAHNLMEISIEKLFSSLKEMHAVSNLYLSTGGVHSAALSDTEGNMLVFREDVGRHNAADKILGYCIRHELQLMDKIFLTSGRVSSEIVGKVAQMGVPVLVSRAAPTSMAIKLAEELGLTVVGFMRGGRANIYTHVDRIR